MIDLKDLEYVAAIAEAGGIQKAAKSVGLSQPALTRRIKNLETHLQLNLFDRLPKGLCLTEAGYMFLKESKSLLTHAYDFEEAMSTYQQGTAGQIAIGVKPGLEDVFFREAIIEYSSRFPSASISIQVCSTPYMVEQIKSGDIDFGLGILGYADEHGAELFHTNELVFEPLCQLPLEIFVRKKHPLVEGRSNSMDIFKYPVASPPPPNNLLSNLQLAYRQAGEIIDRPHVQIDDYGLIYELVAQTDFWSATFASPKKKQAMSEQFAFLGGLELFPDITLGLVWRRSWSVTPCAENLLSILRRYAATWSNI